MDWRVPVLALFSAFIFGCSESNSPVTSNDDTNTRVIQPATKIMASNSRYMREFRRAYNECWKILDDLNHYIQKDPNTDKLAVKVRELDRSFRRLGEAFKKVRNESSAQSAMRSLASYVGRTITRLRRYNLPYPPILPAPCTEPCTMCTDEQRNTYCIQIYQPVCAKIQIPCLKAPCDSIKLTFPNSCEACSNVLVSSYTAGRCR